MIDLSSEQKIRDYINFCTKKENNNYFNALEMLNMNIIITEMVNVLLAIQQKLLLK